MTKTVRFDQSDLTEINGLNKFLSCPNRPAYADAVLIFFVWLMLPALMCVLQKLGYDFGFDIWPMGEFRNWIAFLQSGFFEAPKSFWAIDNRNALSPWWYNAARPLITATPAAPLILDLLAGLFVGLSAYLLMTELTLSRAFGMSIGILAALFCMNAYIDNVNWNFLAALGCTLLSIWFFARFCSDRRKSGYLAASYLTWFVAFTTYTLQLGTIGAVFFVSLRERRSTLSWPRAVFGALADVLPYFALFVLYVMIWVTTSPKGVPGEFNFRFSVDALARSIAFGLWNEHYRWFWIWLIDAGHYLMAIIFGILTSALFVLLRAVDRNAITPPKYQSLGFSLLIGACVAGPIIGFEATSEVWLPGTRWPMLMQFWSPLLFCTFVFWAMSFLPERAYKLCWRSVMAVSTAFIILLGLGFNRVIVLRARQERIFFSQLQAVVSEERISGVTFPRQYLIKFFGPSFLPAGLAADSYAKTILGQDVRFRGVETLPGASEEKTLLIWKDGRLEKAVGGSSP